MAGHKYSSDFLLYFLVLTVGEVNLPIRLNPTVVMYRGMCSALNTDSERSNITQAVSNTLVKSIVYNSNITGPP